MGTSTGSGLTASTWPRITLENIQVNGNTIQVYTTAGLFVGQSIILTKDGTQSPTLFISRVWDARFILLKLENNQDITSINLSQYSGGILDAPEQTRVYVEGTERDKFTFAEGPILANRAIPVSHHGNYLSTQEGALDIDDPESRMIYDNNRKLIEIREFVRDTSKSYNGIIQRCVLPAGLASFNTFLPFMSISGGLIYYYETNGNGERTNSATYTISGFSSYNNSYLTTSGQIIFNSNKIYFNFVAPEYLIYQKTKYFRPIGTSINVNNIYEISSAEYDIFNQSTVDSVAINHITGKIVFPSISNVPKWLKTIGHKFKPSNGLNNNQVLTVTGYNSNTFEVSVTGLIFSESIILNYTIYNEITVTGTFISGSTTGYLDSRFNFIATSVAPSTNGTITANLNGSLGDRVRSTQLLYSASGDIIRTFTTYSTMNGDDIYGKGSIP